MSRCVVARRSLAACLVLVVLAMASPARAAGRAASLEPAGLVEQLVSWLASVWTSAAGLLEPPAGIESPDGGCILDPGGGCRDGAAPPVGEEG